MQHRVGEQFLLGVVHTVEEDGHQQRADLVISDGSVRDALDEEGDLVAGELLAVALLADYVLRSQSLPFWRAVTCHRWSAATCSSQGKLNSCKNRQAAEA